jgi:hypothetical protein
MTSKDAGRQSSEIIRPRLTAQTSSMRYERLKAPSGNCFVIRPNKNHINMLCQYGDGGI